LRGAAHGAWCTPTLDSTPRPSQITKQLNTHN
jgi:hypothetical protein